MDNFNLIAAKILKKYAEITILEESEGKGIIFELKKNRYRILELGENRFPTIVAVDSEDSYPHFMFSDIQIGSEKWRSICLFESGTMIEYIHTEVEKISMCIDRLIRLVTLTSSEIEDEYHKEFLVYWRKYGVSTTKRPNEKYQLYLDDPNQHQWLELHRYKNNYIRITSSNRFFNDIDTRLCIEDIPALYLPLIDVSGLLPPLRNKPWTAHAIMDIVGGMVNQRISAEAFAEIANLSYSKKKILLLFSFQNMYFGCFIEFKHQGTAKLIVKIESQIADVIPIDIARCDFEYLNEQIGNTVHDERVAVVGAGSLGSYIVDELAHAGYRSITVIDGDPYEYTNIFRHRNRSFGCSLPKCLLVEIQTGWMHPELRIQAVDKYLSVDNVDECLPKDVQIIIFAVGSSDVQLQMNAVIKKMHRHVHILYAWLEHDGKSSHVAVVNTWDEGCFECLFTDENGNLCNNIINQADPATLVFTRNGCGGTRIHYGNRTLLTAAALVLNALEDDSMHNAIYSFVDGAMKKTAFPQNARCSCCGVRG